MGNFAKILIALTLTALIHIVLYYSFWAFADKSSKLMLLEKELYEQSMPLNFLFMGDSHCLRSVEVKAFDNSFNWAFYGENNISSFYKLRSYLNSIQEDQYPKQVIFPFDLSNFTRETAALTRNHFYYSRKINSKELQKVSSSPWTVFKTIQLYRIFPYIEWRTLLFKYWKKDQKQESKSNFSLRNHSQEELKKEAQHFFNDQLKINSEADLYDPVSLYYFEQCLQLCKGKGIKAILIKYPMHQSFFQHLPYVKNGQRSDIDPVSAIISKYTGLTILDASGEFKDRNELFFDLHHMNNEGKTVFTKFLKNRLTISLP